MASGAVEADTRQRLLRTVKKEGRCLQLEWLRFQGNGWLFNWEWGPQAEECVNKAPASGQGSSWDPGPSSASSSLDALDKSFPLTRTQFPHVEKERPWS
ncbi:hypothetical protein PRBEI_2001300600 [Prionailurus iriomotensis]